MLDPKKEWPRLTFHRAGAFLSLLACRDPPTVPLLVAFLDLRSEESHDVNCHLVRVETLVVREKNDGQVGIKEMCIFDHAGANVKNHSVAVENVCGPPACKLTVASIVQAEGGPHEFQGLPVEQTAVTQRDIESSQISSAHVQANAAMLVLGIEKVNVVPQFAVGRWRTVPVRFPLHVEAIGLWSEVHVKPYTVRDDIERVSEASGWHT